MKRWRISPVLALSGVLALGGLGVAHAQRASGAEAQARQLLTKLQADHAAKKLAAKPLGRAQAALERAATARAAGDTQATRQLAALALEWAQTGRDVQRAVAAEAELKQVLTKLQATERKAQRARVLLEETHARQARTRSILKRLERQAAEQQRQGPAATGATP